jgi:DNA recombination protein RmuC
MVKTPFTLRVRLKLGCATFRSALHSAKRSVPSPLHSRSADNQTEARGSKSKVNISKAPQHEILEAQAWAVVAFAHESKLSAKFRFSQSEYADVSTFPVNWRGSHKWPHTRVTAKLPRSTTQAASIRMRSTRFGLAFLCRKPKRLLGGRQSSDHRLAINFRQRVIRLFRQELNDSATASRTETRQGFADFQTAISTALTNSSQGQETQLSNFALRIDNVGQALVQQLDNIRGTVEAKLTALQNGNELKLDEMRRTVDEKLEGTLERRLGESFKLVSDRLEQVHKGLGEMQAMATSVGDLKRVLTNVKTRGTWGEIQLGALLEQMLSPQQYAANVTPKPDSGARVEFAIRLPGRSDTDSVVWLPIDSKFPLEDYQRLVDAAERADADGVAQAGKAFEARLRSQARDIRDKYIAPPYTTDFAILFLPSEGLYAEAVRRPGLPESLQQEFRVSLAGPSTFAALLNSLQMGFRTLAIQERSSEVWRVLGAVKTEFGKFADVLAAVKKKIDEASKQIDQTGVRTRAISRTLREVEALPAEDAAQVLPQTLVPDESIGNTGVEDPPPTNTEIRRLIATGT